jgi:hypothetical protein
MTAPDPAAPQGSMNPPRLCALDGQRPHEKAFEGALCARCAMLAALQHKSLSLLRHFGFAPRPFIYGNN